jgi:hypothetical protein
MADGGSVGLLIVVTGASHLLYGSRGVGLPARISRKLQKKTQVVVLLNPERQRIRMEGNVPEVKQCLISLCYSGVFSPSHICHPGQKCTRILLISNSWKSSQFSLNFDWNLNMCATGTIPATPIFFFFVFLVGFLCSQNSAFLKFSVCWYLVRSGISISLSSGHVSTLFTLT